jgi:hypothetical protein
MKRGMHWAQVAGVLMLLWALIPDNPYGHYILLRFVVCGLFVCLAISAYTLGKILWIWVFAATAFLYNPLIQFHLGREVWEIVNVGTIVLVGVSYFILRKSERLKNPVAP